jgi:hypothetical protein
VDYSALVAKYHQLRAFKELKYSPNKTKVEVNLDFVLRELQELNKLENKNVEIDKDLKEDARVNQSLQID